VFKTVCVDAAYYTFPSVKYLEGLAAQVPSDFQFAFKVTDAITLKRFPNLPRFGIRAGQPNQDFLSAEAFTNRFLAPCKSILNHIGILIFEFSRFHSPDFAQASEFVAALDSFLAALSKDWPYGIEMRNKHWLSLTTLDKPDLLRQKYVKLSHISVDNPSGMCEHITHACDIHESK